MLEINTNVLSLSQSPTISPYHKPLPQAHPIVLRHHRIPQTLAIIPNKTSTITVTTSQHDPCACTTSPRGFLKSPRPMGLYHLSPGFTSHHDPWACTTSPRGSQPQVTMTHGPAPPLPGAHNHKSPQPNKTVPTPIVIITYVKPTALLCMPGNKGTVSATKHLSYPTRAIYLLCQLYIEL